MSRKVILLIALFLSWMAPNIKCAAIPIQDEGVKIENSAQRTWQTADGRFRQQGALVEVLGDKIRLLTPEGKRMTVPLNKLSNADKKFVASESAKNASPFKEDQENSPFKSEDQAPESNHSRLAAPKEVQINFSGAKPIQLQSRNLIDMTAKWWQISEDADEIQPVQIPCESVHWDVKHCFSSSDNRFLIVAFHDPFGKEQGGHLDQPQMEDSDFDSAFDGAHAEMRKAMQQARERQNSAFRGSRSPGGSLGKERAGSGTKNWVQVFEISTGEQTGKYALPDETEISDYNPQGQIFLAASGKFSSSSRVQIFALERNRLVPKMIGHGSRGLGLSTIHSARFLADGKIVVTLSDKLVVLRGDTMRPASSCSISRPDWRLANDQRHALIENQGRLF
jgi:hypothetical protein